MATQTFHNVLNVIQECGLNFKMEISPFSATVQLKNSALKDQNGNQLVIEPQRNINDDQTKVKSEKYARDINHLENANRILQSHVENALSDSDKMYNTNKQLENVIETLQYKLSNSDQKIVELADAAAINEALKKENRRLMQEALDQASAYDALNQVASRVKNELHASNLKAKMKLDETRKDLKAEIKSWR